MKRLSKFILLGILLVILVFFLKTLIHNFGTTPADEIKIENSLIVDTQGNPISGTILGTIDHLDKLIDPILGLIAFGDWSNLSFGKKLNYLKTDKMMEELQGFSVQAKIENGKLTDKTSIYYDLRKAKDKVLGYDIPKNFAFYLGYLFSNQVKVAEAAFDDNKLNGDSYLYMPGSKNSFEKNMSVTFEDNHPKSTKKYYKNGKLKRINNYDSFKKEGIQQEYSKDGQLKYEVNYAQGKKQWEKSYYWTLNKLRKHRTINAADQITEKIYYPNGELAKDENPEGRTDWFSNGEIKLYKTIDSFYYGSPKSKVETYHKSGLLATSYDYNAEGKINGPYEINYKSGKTWEKGTFKDGYKHGNLKKWYTNGQIAENHQMVWDKIHGPFVRYYDDGVLWKEFNYDNGKLYSKYKKWWKNGKPAFDCEYKNNRAVTCLKWNDEGKVIK